MSAVDLALTPLSEWIRRYSRVFVLTGAGCSTASGIPDYRDAAGQWKRRPPVMFQALRDKAEVYQRYWARAYAGWPRFATVTPNAAHHALAAWESAGGLHYLVTQNVDGLHQRAGSERVIDLHGRLDTVVCLDCRARSSRETVQAAIATDNPFFAPESLIAPDGDADIADAAIAAFHAPRCTACGGRLKPDVVFFGENVPVDRYDQARHALEGADALLAVGTSLMVYSGFRFVRAAHEAGLPIAILNRGVTRADDLATLRLDADVGATLARAITA